MLKRIIMVMSVVALSMAAGVYYGKTYMHPETVIAVKQFDGVIPPEPKQSMSYPSGYVMDTPAKEMAFMLARLEKQTRDVIGSRLFRPQEEFSGIPTKLYQEILIKNGILPAGIAGHIFSTTVPEASNGKATVKMVVENPRNPKNTGDAIELELLREAQETKSKFVFRTLPDGTAYYGEPIVVPPGAIVSHGPKKGQKDPYFPQYKKDGWEVGQIIGIVVARVSP